MDRHPPARRWGRVVAAFAAILLILGLPSSLAAPAQADNTPVSCNTLLTAQHTADGHTYGESSCVITGQSTVATPHGAFNRVDVGLSGTAFGCADPNTQGNTRKDLPDAGTVAKILFTQFGITSCVDGVGVYTGTPTATNAGAGLTVLYPARGTPWNGRVFLSTHGQSNNTPLGDIVPTGSAVTFNNLYVREMIDAGYAVIYVRRPASSGVPTTLDNGQVIDESINDNVGTYLDFLQSGLKLLYAQLGRTPVAVYGYGHSAGVIINRLLNYSGLNFRPDGTRYVTAFLSDDPGGGLPLPIGMPMGQVLGERNGVATFDPRYLLFTTPAQRAKFTPELTLAHELYQDVHSWLPQGVTYLRLKEQAQVLYLQEGLGDETRLYRVNGVSHIANTDTSPPNTLDIGPVITAMIANLNLWISYHVAPPPTMANLAEVGGRNMRGVPTAVQLPPLACPTGFRFSGPPPGGASSSTGYAPYDGVTLEPVNSAGVLEDVWGAGYRKPMPTVSQAWDLLGITPGYVTVTPQMFRGCVARSVAQLVNARIITRAAGDSYNQQALKFPALDW